MTPSDNATISFVNEAVGGSLNPPCALQIAKNLFKATPLSSICFAKYTPWPEWALPPNSNKIPARASALFFRSTGASGSLRKTDNISFASSAGPIPIPRG